MKRATQFVPKPAPMTPHFYDRQRVSTFHWWTPTKSSAQKRFTLNLFFPSHRRSAKAFTNDMPRSNWYLVFNVFSTQMYPPSGKYVFYILSGMERKCLFFVKMFFWTSLDIDVVNEQVTGLRLTYLNFVNCLFRYSATRLFFPLLSSGRVR